MVGRGNGVEEVLGSSATLLRLLGLWSPEEQGGRGYVVLALLFLTAAMPVLKLLMDRPQELEELGACIFVALMLCEIFSKMVCFFVQGPTLRRLVKMLTEMRTQDRSNKRNDQIRLRYQRLGERMFLLIMATAIATDATWSATPAAQQLLGRSGTSPRPWPLPLPTWLPVDTRASPAYELLYAAQVLLIPLSTTSVCSDFVFIGLMLRISAELEILNESISGLHKIRKGVSTATKIEAKPIDRVSDDEINRRISRNVKHHQEILKCAALLEEAMSTAIFILFLGTMIAISVNIFAATAVLQTVGGMTKAMKMVTAIPPILFEVGLYCIFGQIVTDQSEKLMHSAYSCGWADCDARFRRSLLTFCVGTRRPVEITAGTVYKLSKETFLQVLNGSYAMFNMLYGFQSNRS